APVASTTADRFSQRRTLKKVAAILTVIVITVAIVFVAGEHNRRLQEQAKWRDKTLAVYQSIKKHKAAGDFRLADMSLSLLSQFGMDQKPNPGGSILALLRAQATLEARQKQQPLEGEFSLLLDRSPLIQELRVFRRRYQALTGQSKVPLNDPLEKAFQSLYKGEYQEAKVFFQWTKSNRKEDEVIASLGLAVVAQKSGHFRIAKDELKECFLKSEKIQFFISLFQRALMADSLQRIARAKSQKELEEALKELRRYDKAPYRSERDLSAAWIEKLTQQLNQEEDAEDFVRIYEWLALSKPRYPRFATLRPTPLQLGLLGLRARQKGELLKAYEYFFRAARDPRFQ
ncbi:MAG: hypothetical protein P1V97_08045, partial [Planctomycetota bacterium]|nr:hypothetical protein [Planctomycetota bacterium]